MYTLHVDDRERAVSEYLKMTNRKVERLTCGDYAIVYNNGTIQRIVDIIERKTLEDYAASIKDGRLSNMEKLLEARAHTGCNIKLIIEGPAFPDDETVFGGIPYKSIAASILNMQVRYNIIVLYTKSQYGTAIKLEKLVASYEHIETTGSYESRLPICLNYKQFNPDPACTDNMVIYAVTQSGSQITFNSLFDQVNQKFVQIGDPIINIIVQPNIFSHSRAAATMEIIKGSVEHKLEDDVRNTRLAIKGVGQESFNATLHLSIAEIIDNVNLLDNCKLPNGNKMPKTAKEGFLLFLTDSTAAGIRFLKEINGVSQNCAAFIMKAVNGSFENLCKMTEGNIANLMIRKTAVGPQQRIGPVMAKKIYDVLHFRVLSDLRSSTPLASSLRS